MVSYTIPCYGLSSVILTNPSKNNFLYNVLEKKFNGFSAQWSKTKTKSPLGPHGSAKALEETGLLGETYYFILKRMSCCFHFDIQQGSAKTFFPPFAVHSHVLCGMFYF